VGALCSLGLWAHLTRHRRAPVPVSSRSGYYLSFCLEQRAASGQHLFYMFGLISSRSALPGQAVLLRFLPELFLVLPGKLVEVYGVVHHGFVILPIGL